MEFYKKFVDRFQDLSKESCSHQGEGLIITQSLQEKGFGKFDAVTLTIHYLNVLRGMDLQNSQINFS